jgi:hypothetical protein
MNIQPKCSLGRGKTLTDADPSVLVGGQQLLPGKQDGKNSCPRLSASDFVAYDE